MPLKNSFNNLFNLLIFTNLLFHNKIINKKNAINSKFKNFSKIVNLSVKDMEKIYSFLLKNNHIYYNDNFLNINWQSIDKLIDYNNVQKCENTIIVEDSLDIIVKPEICITDFIFLIKFAEIINQDVIYKFKITQNSLHNAYNLSINKDEILKFLKKLNHTKNISDTVKFAINDIFKRTGEVFVSTSGGLISANKFIVEEIKNIPEIKKFILTFIDDNIILLKPNSNLTEIYYILKEKSFFPKLRISEVVRNKNNYLLSLTNEEAKYFFTAVKTLKTIGIEHNFNMNFNVLEKLIINMKELLDETTIKESKDLSIEYKKTLDKAIKSYILKTLKHSIREPHILVTNKLSERYSGDNPATTKKSMKEMINYAITNKLLLFVEYVKSNLSTKAESYTVFPEYLYNDVLICREKKTKKKLELILKNISYIILL